VAPYDPTFSLVFRRETARLRQDKARVRHACERVNSHCHVLAVLDYCRVVTDATVSIYDAHHDEERGTE